MRKWETDGSPLADSRLPCWLKWLFASNAPEWAIRAAYWVVRHV
jgi:hypothetical protein